MSKSYFFQHDYNAANDHKVLFLRQQLGMEGYGIFWYIVEQLAQSGGRLPIKIVPVLALQMQTSADKVLSVIRGYELFEVDQEEFFSHRLNKHLHQMQEFKTWGSLGGRAKALKQAKNEDLSTPPSSPPTTPSLHNTENKENKEKEIQLPFGPEFASIWNDWVEYRKESKQKLTPKSIKLQLKELGSKTEAEAIEMIRQSIRNGWRGIFPVKNQGEKVNKYGLH